MLTIVNRFKYLLIAVTNKMLPTFRKDQGSGYDNSCQFKVTLNNSSIGPLKCSLNYTSLVNAFHRHAHQCLCQLSHLANYQKGLGIKDLSMCEHSFSQSNAMGTVMWGMSVFHQHQEIVYLLRFYSIVYL